MPATTPAVKVTAAEELDAVLHWRNKHAQAIRERDALQLLLNQRDEQIDALTASGLSIRDEWRKDQQRLTAADERADVLEVIVGEVLDAVGREPLNLDAVLRLRSRMRAALKPAECAADEHVCTGCGAKGWTANCKECVPY